MFDTSAGSLNSLPPDPTILSVKFFLATSCFDAGNPSIQVHEDENKLKILLLINKLPYDPSDIVQTDRVTGMSDFKTQFVIPIVAARGPMFINAVTLSLLTFDAEVVMDRNNFAATFEGNMIMCQSYV